MALPLPPSFVRLQKNTYKPRKSIAPQSKHKQLQDFKSFAWRLFFKIFLNDLFENEKWRVEIFKILNGG